MIFKHTLLYLFPLCTETVSLILYTSNLEAFEGWVSLVALSCTIPSSLGLPPSLLSSLGPSFRFIMCAPHFISSCVAPSFLLLMKCHSFLNSTNFFLPVFNLDIFVILSPIKIFHHENFVNIVKIELRNRYIL